MKLAAIVLGLAGGFVGLICTWFAVSVAEFLMQPGEEAAITRGGGFGVLFSLLGMLGAVAARWSPKLGGAILIVAAVGGGVAIGSGYLLAGLLLVIAGVLGLSANLYKPSETVQGTAPLAGGQMNSSTAEPPTAAHSRASKQVRWPRFDPNKPGDLERAYAEAVRQMHAQQDAPSLDDGSRSRKS
jgi:hypothetical protein